jgi:HEAT repeat protein
MRAQTGLVLLLCLLASGGCSKGKSTDEWLAYLKSGKGGEPTIAARSLPLGEAEKVVPALIEALKHKDNHVRRSSAIKLGAYGEQAKDAIPALQKMAHVDGDARAREAAGIALSRIDPERFPYSPVSGLIEALKDKSSDKRRNAAIQLGGLRENAKDAIPALQKAQQDRDAKVREAAGIALSRIDPERFASAPKGRSAVASKKP